MLDIVAIGIVVLFFALMVLFVRWCDRVVGSVTAEAGEPPDRQEVGVGADAGA